MTILPKGPIRLPLAGNLIQFGKDPLQFLTDCRKKYGNIVRLKIEQERDTFLINDPEDIEFVLKHSNKLFTKGYYRDPILHVVLGNGLVTSEGDFWKKQRRMSQPVFRMEQIKRYTETMRDYTMEQIHAWNIGELDIHDELMKVTMRIAAKTLFGYDTQCKQHSNDVSYSMETVQKEYNKQLTSVLKRILSLIKLDSVSTRGDKRLQEAVKNLDQIIYEIIETRRNQTGEIDNDLLSILMNVEDEEDGSRMTNQQLRDEVMTFFLAGHETTANTLSWCFYLIGNNQEALARLQEELHEKVGANPITIDNLHKLTFMDQVLKEVMRLYPAVWLISRETMEETVLQGYTIPKHAEIAMSQWVMHRHPAYFHHPDSFIPERWENDLEKKLPNYVYFPFGGGPRICIGNYFALTEAKIILGTILQHYHVQIKGKELVNVEPSITLRPKDGIKVQITKV